MKNENDDVKIQIGEGGKMIVYEGGNPTEIVQVPMEGKAAENAGNDTGGEPVIPGIPPSVMQGIALLIATGKSGQIGAVRTDKRHHYVVIVGGVPMFASSSLLPDRLKALMAMGIPMEACMVLDVTNGAIGIIQKRGNEA